jgi:hypothetical protein
MPARLGPAMGRAGEAGFSPGSRDGTGAGRGGARRGRAGLAGAADRGPGRGGPPPPHRRLEGRGSLRPWAWGEAPQRRTGPARPWNSSTHWTPRLLLAGRASARRARTLRLREGPKKGLLRCRRRCSCVCCCCRRRSARRAVRRGPPGRNRSPRRRPGRARPTDPARRDGEPSCPPHTHPAPPTRIERSESDSDAGGVGAGLGNGSRPKRGPSREDVAAWFPVGPRPGPAMDRAGAPSRPAARSSRLAAGGLRWSCRWRRHRAPVTALARADVADRAGGVCPPRRRVASGMGASAY